MCRQNNNFLRLVPHIHNVDITLFWLLWCNCFINGFNQLPFGQIKVTNYLDMFSSVFFFIRTVHFTFWCPFTFWSSNILLRLRPEVFRFRFKLWINVWLSRFFRSWNPGFIKAKSQVRTMHKLRKMMRIRSLALINGLTTDFYFCSTVMLVKLLC